MARTNDIAGGRDPSASVGDYAKAIWEVAGEAGVASTKDVAGRLSVSAASVTGMFGRMRELGLVEYERYRGATLTEKGRAEAMRLVRRHRLIETLLTERLGYSWQDVHEEAERLEHAVSDQFTERLAEFLGHPDHDPHGDPIPAADGTLVPEGGVPLPEMEAGERVVISSVGDESPEALHHLGERGLTPGRHLVVRETRALDGVVIVEDEKGREHSLGNPLARQILVRKIPSKPTP